MREGRQHFRQQLLELEEEIQAMAVEAERLFEMAIRALSAQDLTLYRSVVSGDDTVDAYYLSIERRVVALFALQSPVVASDLRLLTALLHINGHLERVADMAVNIAKIGESSKGLPRNTTMLDNLEEMSGIAIGMLEAAMDALARRDLALSRRLPAMDKRIDELNRGMLAEVMAAAEHLDALQWCVAMHLVSRQVERVGDHAVDIGEQVAYLVTGDFQEFTDASHPEIEQADAGPSGDDPAATGTG